MRPSLALVSSLHPSCSTDSSLYACSIACATGHNKGGMVLNIVTPAEVDMLRNIESFFRIKIVELPHNFATASQ